MSLQTTNSVDFGAGEKLHAGDLAYLSQRAKNSCYDFVMRKFLASGITKAELGRRIGKTPSQMNHLLATPANWTIKTMAELLAGIAKEEFIPGASPIAGRAPRNFTQADLLKQRIGHLRAVRSEPNVEWQKMPSPRSRIRVSPNEQWQLETRETQDA